MTRGADSPPRHSLPALLPGPVLMVVLLLAGAVGALAALVVSLAAVSGVPGSRLLARNLRGQPRRLAREGAGVEPTPSVR
ncbi:MAG: hypothetical protein L0H93_21595, partial [Nocardioides sp.]|nr:hypothetical protein [Nocardioides sp.]